ncbi:MAG: isoamylase early set domain-containing protein [Candidatus Promineifilaceae bacterium]|nr:isoamylase early set domain-containing protein [Candidatus Promineifilaceae bacterium]
MLHKRHIDYLNLCRVTFEVPAADVPAADVPAADVPATELPEDGPVASLVVVGDFNDWDAAATPLRYNATKEAYQAAVKLEPDQVYQYRYLLNGQRWFNDPQANHYVRGQLGELYSILVIPGGASLNSQTDH